MDRSGIEGILRKQQFCVLAAASRDGQPCVAPVYYNYDDALNLVWESSHRARHSQAITENSRVAVVVADLVSGDPARALYIDARAAEVPSSSLDEALRVFREGPHDSVESRKARLEDYAANQPLRLYRAMPEHVYVLHVTRTPNGRRVDEREEVAFR
jgi:nitroimidazol reductase NimA-like FMN-containing flavoprotein (pyridoxamine 5'-phosphate oxidase superfamily)